VESLDLEYNDYEDGAQPKACRWLKEENGNEYAASDDEL
jgi:hypothetical protein